MYETLWTFKTRNFTVKWAICPDDDCYLSFDETGETAEKVASGEWQCFVSKVAVYYRGCEIGADYLGGSIYADPREFRDHIGLAAKFRADGVNYGSYFTDMVREAIKQARKNMVEAPTMRHVA